jgi:tetratricopeptide (TPR) repeat protein
MTDVFLSHSSQDSQFALRVRIDLQRSGLRVWTYQTDSELGTDLRIEYLEQIAAARHFCVLDGRHARRSDHVRRECQYARECSKRIIVGLTEARAGGRDSWWKVEPFPEFNSLTHVELDQKGYEAGIQELCRAFGGAFIPAIAFPRAEEFRAEVERSKLPFKRAARLLEMWWEFVELYGRDRALGESQLRVLIASTDRLVGQHLVSVRVSLGVVLADQARHREALAVFEQVVNLAPDDARSWAGVGGAQYYLGRHGEAIESLRRCESLLVREGASVLDVNASALRHNIARVLEAQRRGREALEALGGLSRQESEWPQVLALYGRLFLRSGQPRLARDYLERASAAYELAERKPDASLIIDVLNCYRDLEWYEREIEFLEAALRTQPSVPELWKRAAEAYHNRAQDRRALHCLEQAASLSPASIEYRAELCAMYRRLGDPRAAQAEAFRCLEHGNATPRERYFLGLVLYVGGAVDLAHYALSQSRNDPVVATWPVYEELGVE